MPPALADYLQALTTRCEQATKGPWTPFAQYQPETGRDEATPEAPYLVDPDGRNVAAAMIGGFADMREVAANVRFMAGARTDLPTLVRLVRGFMLDLARALCNCGPADSIDGGEHDQFCPYREALARAERIVKEGG